MTPDYPHIPKSFDAITHICADLAHPARRLVLALEWVIWVGRRGQSGRHAVAACRGGGRLGAVLWCAAGTLQEIGAILIGVVTHQ